MRVNFSVKINALPPFQPTSIHCFALTYSNVNTPQKTTIRTIFKKLPTISANFLQNAPIISLFYAYLALFFTHYANFRLFLLFSHYFYTIQMTTPYYQINVSRETFLLILTQNVQNLESSRITILKQINIYLINRIQLLRNKYKYTRCFTWNNFNKHNFIYWVPKLYCPTTIWNSINDKQKQKNTQLNVY